MKKSTIGVIGNGFVGEAIVYAFSPLFNIRVYDVDPLKSVSPLEEVHNLSLIHI